jgi:hypothetical protein
VENMTCQKSQMDEKFSSKCLIEKIYIYKNDEKSYIQIMDENPYTWMNPTSSKIMDERKI